MFSLKDKVALITGATSGIGLAVAKNFVEAGARVVITGRRDANTLAKEIGAHFISLDVTKEDQVKQVLAQVAGEYGQLDVLVLNAGIAEDAGTMTESSSDTMRRCLDVNCMGVYYGLKYAPAHMPNGSAIIVTGSAAGSGTTTVAHGEYAASKAAAAYLVRTSAIELAPNNIRVNAVCPAAIAGTGMMAEDDGGPDATFYSAQTAFGRMGRQDEVVGIYNFLAGSGSTFITGQEICVDGGMTAGTGLPAIGAIMAPFDQA
ncbi:MAG: SDR family oxidoreductase [Motiliproteus sp.]